MNPLIDALQLADNPSRASATPEVDVSAGLEFFGDRQIEPVQPAPGDIDPAPVSPAAFDAGGSSDPEGPDAWRLGPIRATRDELHEPIQVSGLLRSHATASSGPPDSGTAPDLVIPAGPSRVTDRAAAAPGGHVHSTPHECPDAGKSTSSAPGSLGPRHPERSAGVVRIAGIALSLIAVTAAAVVGGYLIWKTEFVRPALVGDLSPKSLAVVDLMPVHSANAALHEVGEAAGRGSLRTDTPEESNRNAAAGTRTSEDAAGVRAIWDADTSILDRSVASRLTGAAETPEPGRPEPMPRWDGRSATHASSRSSSGHAASGHAARAALERRVRFPGTDTPGLAAPGLDASRRVPAGVSVDSVDITVPEPTQDRAEPRSDAGTGIVVRKRIRPDHVAASLERAYRAFLSGDATSAAQAYRDVLGQEPGNRDAHLGLAALAVRSGRWNDAAGHYARVLESHPDDIVARAALIASEERDPARGESRLKVLLRRHPNAAHLHFDLGNLYAAQRRWPEAQRSWSNAYRFDPGNADYAYNLAVSLDHLSRPESALRHYREALLLSRSRAAGFESAKVLQRIRALDSNAETGPTPDGTTADAAVPPSAVRTR